MGYDLVRFIGAIDEEFYCTICTMVLEEPLQSPCDHLFCSNCIKDWLVVDKSCPVDRRPLTINSLKPPARYFLNMLGKLDIKCAFRKFIDNTCGTLELRQDGGQRESKINVMLPHLFNIEFYHTCNIATWNFNIYAT